MKRKRINIGAAPGIESVLAKDQLLERLAYVYSELVEAIEDMPEEVFNTFEPTHVTAHYPEYNLTFMITEPGGDITITTIAPETGRTRQ